MSKLFLPLEATAMNQPENPENPRDSEEHYEAVPKLPGHVHSNDRNTRNSKEIGGATTENPRNIDQKKEFLVRRKEIPESQKTLMEQ